MASSSSAPAITTAADDDVPPLPAKLRPKPQPLGSIGVGKRYATQAVFDADVKAWEAEKQQRNELVQLRRQVMERQRERGRNRSQRQRDGEDETDSDRRVRQRSESEAQCSAHLSREAARSMNKQQSARLEEQRASVQSCTSDLLNALLVCVARSRQGCCPEMCTPMRCAFMHARYDVLRCLYQLQYAAEHPPNGRPGWWQSFECAADGHNVCSRNWSEQELEWIQQLHTSEVAWDAALVGTESRRDEWLGWEDVAGRNVIIFLRSQLAAQRLKLPSWRGIWGKSGESWITLSNAAQCALYDSEHPDMHWSGKWWRCYRIGTPHEASLRSEFIDAHRVHFELCQYTKDGKATW